LPPEAVEVVEMAELRFEFGCDSLAMAEMRLFPAVAGGEPGLFLALRFPSALRDSWCGKVADELGPNCAGIGELLTLEVASVSGLRLEGGRSVDACRSMLNVWNRQIDNKACDEFNYAYSIVIGGREGPEVEIKSRQ